MTRHDWNAYQEKCHTFHTQWLRSLTPAESLDLYQGLHRLRAGSIRRFARMAEAVPETLGGESRRPP